MKFQRGEGLDDRFGFQMPFDSIRFNTDSSIDLAV